MPSKTPAPPRIPVRAGLVDVKYVRDRREAAELDKTIKRWRRSVGPNPSPSQRDAVEFAALAVRRWREAYLQKRTATSLKRIQDMIRDQSTQEIRVLAVARAAWRKRDPVVGICLFRRTWCNNIALDLLAVHPLLDELDNSPVAGLGSGLIHHICFVAEQIKAGAIWGESTQNSYEFYDGLVDRPKTMRDLIELPAKKYLKLKASIEKAQIGYNRIRSANGTD